VNQLFFEVLAVKETERSQTDAKIKALHFVPYLNSSLFEKSALEKQLGTINNLTENELPLHPKTVLKHQGERRKGALRNIDYLLSFLDAYDFGSDAQDEGVQHTDKTLINASVLGLVFEKINGYKEGSFYTPSVITMYMCKESLRLMVLQKLNEAFEWQHTQWEELKTACQNFGVNERNTANAVINSLKICDPAVGSGHFLVSALNELLAIKADLELLCKDGKPYRLDITIVNDELVIQDDTTTGLFQYQVALDKDENRTVAKRTQAVQELLFDEKRTLIEKTLFGVDINPNSVQICRLRLWIELLKHTYYKPETAFKELETLPNIDINIKCGNSLISQFGLTEKIDGRTSKGKAIAELQELVADYHRESNKEKKHALDERMKEIKATVVESIRESSPERANLSKLRISLQALEHEEIILRGKLEDPDYIAVFESKVKSMKQELVQIRRTITSTRKKLQKAEAFIQEAKQNPIYKHAFEWRFEFPDVLNPTTGDFEGFDVVIGNPPYMRVQELQKYALDLKRNYEANYKTAVGGYELANLFYERGIELLKATGVKTYIMPHKFLNSENGTGLRDYLLQKKTLTTLLHFGANMVFDSADTYTAITLSKKQADVSDGFLFYKTPFNRNFMQELKSFDFPFSLNTYQNIQTNTKCYNADAWILFNTPKEHAIFQKIYQYPQTIVGKIFEEVFVGLQTSFDNLYILHDCIQNKGTLTGVRESYKQVFPEKSYTVETEFFKPFLMGKNVHRYETLQTTQYVFFPYQLIEGKAIPVTLEVLKHSYPLTYAYVMENEVHFKARESGKAAKLEHWFGYIYPKNLVKFEQPKLSSMEICTNEPNVTLNDSNLYHTTKVYSWVKKKTCLLSDYYLLAFLNSNLFWWFLMNTGDTLQSDSRTIKTNYVNPFPIPTNASPQSSEKLAGLVKQVMLCKQENYKADTKDLEAEIDVLVYQLYNLTYAEVLVVQPSFALPQATYEAGLTSMQALAMASPTAPPTTATVDVTTPTQPQLNFE
jgi:methylase of polypeptide subunit release factors